MQSDIQIDIVIVIGDKDMRFIRYTIYSVVRFWHPINSSSLNLVVYQKNQDYINEVVATVKSITSPNLVINVVNREEFLERIGKTSIQLSPPEVNQRYIKMFAFLLSSADFLWFVDSDYLFSRRLSEKKLIPNDLIDWSYALWDESSVSENSWRAGSEVVAGHEIRHNFMLAPPYIYKRKDLISAATNVNDENIRDAGTRFSEFIYLGDYAFNQHLDWVNFVKIDGGGRKMANMLLHQDPFSGQINLLKKGIEFEYSNYYFLVYWSHHGEIEDLMSERLQLCLKENYSSKKEIQTFSQVARYQFLRLIKRSEIIDSIKKYYSYSDGWVYKNIDFELEPGMSIRIEFKLLKNSELIIGQDTKEFTILEFSDNKAILEIRSSRYKKRINIIFKSEYFEEKTNRRLNALLVT